MSWHLENSLVSSDISLGHVRRISFEIISIHFISDFHLNRSVEYKEKNIEVLKTYKLLNFVGQSFKNENLKRLFRRGRPGVNLIKLVFLRH